MDVRLDVKALMREMGERARAAADELAYAPSARKDVRPQFGYVSESRRSGQAAE